jgi:small subunit ribosomal protein S3
MPRKREEADLMGHKVHPIGFRLGVVKGWQSSWFAERDYKDILAEDHLIRKIVNKELANASVSRIEIERAAADQVLVKVFTARPGIVIGKSGEKVDRLRGLIEAKTKKRRVRMDIVEIRQPELDATLVGRSIAEQLEKRVSFRRAMKQAVQKSMRANAKGIKIIVGGRLGGAEIARSEKEVEGKVPLQTLRADIDYGQAEAHTTFGVIGIKVWIYRGDILPSKRREPGEVLAEAATQQTFAPREERGERRGERRPRGERQQGGERGPRQPRGQQQGGQQGGERGPRQPRGQQQGGQQGGERGPRQPRGQQQGGQQGGERGPRQPRGQQQGGQQGGERGPRQPRQPRQQGGEGERVKQQSQQAPAPTQAPVSSEKTPTPPVTPSAAPISPTDNGTPEATTNE